MTVAESEDRVAFEEGGAFDMGSTEGFHPDDGEGPVRSVRVAPFAIDRYAVTNERFARFVAEAAGWTPRTIRTSVA